MLRQNQYRDDAELIEIAQELVHLKDQEFFVGHGVQIAVEAVDHDHARFLLFDSLAHNRGKLAGRHFSWVDLLNDEAASCDMGAKGNAQTIRAGKDGSQSFVECKENSMFPALGCGNCVCQSHRRFPNPRSADE